MVESEKREVEFFDPINRGPVVFTGLWGNPQFPKYQLEASVFKPFGIMGEVYGATNVLSWSDFRQKILRGIKSSIDSNGENSNGEKRIFIGNSIASTYLLTLVYEERIPFRQLFLFGFDPDPNRRILRDQQISIWIDGLNIDEKVVKNFLDTRHDLSSLEEALEWARRRDDVFFIHGEDDETIPVEELVGLNLRNLIIIPGMDHNSTRSVERVLPVLFEKTTDRRLLFFPIRSNFDLLSLPQAVSRGILPYFSGNRIGFGVVFEPQNTQFPFNSFKDEFIFFGERNEMPPNFFVISEFSDGRVYGISIPSLLREGYSFYSPLVPPRSVYMPLPQDLWVRNMHLLSRKIPSESRVITSTEKKLNDELDYYSQRAHEFLSNINLSDLLDYFDDDNNLMKHCFEVYKTLKLMGIDDNNAFFLSIFHDIGKGLLIKINQLFHIKHLFSNGRLNDLTENDLRLIGSYRNLINDENKLWEQIIYDEEKIERILMLYGFSLNDLQGDITDRTLSLKILEGKEIDLRAEIFEGLLNYLKGDFNDFIAQIIRLADFVSPFLAYQDHISVEIIRKVINFRLLAINERYGTDKKIDDYLTEDLLNYLQRYLES